MIDPSEAPDGEIAAPVHYGCEGCKYELAGRCPTEGGSLFCVARNRTDKHDCIFKDRPDPKPLVDITDDSAPVVDVDRKTDCEIQAEMIEYHHQCLIRELGRDPSPLEVCQSWVEKGFAALYRKHYHIEGT